MSDIIEIPTSSTSFINLTSSDVETPKCLAISKDGYAAILYPNSINLGVIGFDADIEGKRCLLNEEIINIDFKFENVLSINDFNENSDDSEALSLMLDRNFNNPLLLDTINRQLSFCEWSPMDYVSNMSILAISRWDGRIVVIGRHKTPNLWEKEFDVTDLYHRYYRDNLLKNAIYGSTVQCQDSSKYIDLKNDLKLTDFSWSVLVRQFNSHNYFLLVTVSRSGIIVIWRIINHQKGSCCEFLYSERLNLKSGKPLNVKFCDISDTVFLITVINSNDVTTCYPYSIVADDRLTVKTLSAPLVVNQQTRYCQKTKIHWSIKLSQLIVGFEWKLFISKISLSQREANKFDIESAMVYLPSNSEVTGLSVKGSTAYVCTRDGCLFGVKLSTNITSIELNQIVFTSEDLSSGKNEFLDVFVSPNSVYLGFLNLVAEKRDYKSNLATVYLMGETQSLNVLMDETVPFGRKQDAVEQIQHLYFNMRNLLPESISKLGKPEITWDNCSMHRLKFMRYICIFFGYRLQDQSGIDCTHIRRLESIIVIRTICQWLSGFSDISSDNIDRFDCVFVLRMVRKLKLLSMPMPMSPIDPVIDVAEKKALLALRTTFSVSEGQLERYKECGEEVVCSVCTGRCELGVGVVRCQSGHEVLRCCKTLDVCVKGAKGVRRCAVCGAWEKMGDIKDLSNWRLEIVNSNCSLCDGTLLNV